MTDNTDEAVSERLLQPTTSRLFLLVIGACLVYAGIRYHVAEGVPLAQAPLYVLNKAISLGGLAFLAMSYLVGKVAGLRWDDRQLQLVVIKFCGLNGAARAPNGEEQRRRLAWPSSADKSQH